MKKFITILAAAFIAVAAFAQDLPAFTEADNAYVFDAKLLKKPYGDYCKLVNMSFEKGLSFDVYLMKSNKKEWVCAGGATLNEVLETVTLDSDYNGDYSKYRYFALVPKDGRKYNVEFVWDMIDMYVVKHQFSAFLISIDGETPESIRNNSVVIDVNSIKGKFKDNVKVQNKSSDANIDVVILGFNEEGDSNWEIAGKVKIDELDESESMETPLHEVDAKKYNYYAVYFPNGKKYNVTATKARNDLVIEVQ